MENQHSHSGKEHSHPGKQRIHDHVSEHQDDQESVKSEIIHSYANNGTSLNRGGFYLVLLTKGEYFIKSSSVQISDDNNAFFLVTVKKEGRHEEGWCSNNIDGYNQYYKFFEVSEGIDPLMSIKIEHGYEHNHFSQISHTLSHLIVDPRFGF